MTRVVKDHDIRRNEILDVAQQRFQSQGYEQTSIQEIIDAIGIAKGTFYHYFDSKPELLDELANRMLENTLVSAQSIVNDDQLNAQQKFEAFFAYIGNWKTENRVFLCDLLSVFHRDENTLFRQKLKVATTRRAAPILADIVRQGVDEGVFVTDYPDDIGDLILMIGRSLSETIGSALLDENGGGEPMPFLQRKIAVHEDAIERLLGAPKGSLQLFDVDNVKLWFDRAGQVDPLAK